MQFAVLGANETLLPLLRAAADEGHRCVATSDLGRWAASVAALTPDASRDVAWELLISQPPAMLPGQSSDASAADSLVDAVVLALDHGGGEAERQRRTEQLRKLAGAGMPVMVVTPACEGIVGYELDMIRRDTRVVLFPYSPLACHEGAKRIRQLMHDANNSTIGEVDQLVLERTATVETDAQRLELLAQDAHLLDHILGGLREVAASSSREGTLEQLSAHVQGREAVARWNLIRGPQPQLRVSLLGAQGRVEWSVCDSPIAEHIDQFGAGHWNDGGGPSPLRDNGASRAWQAFADQIAGEAGEPQLTWEGACRAAEVADHTPRSVQRGRAVSMQDQTPTEEDTFKGMMAAGSCGMLLVVLLVFVVWGVVESVRFPAERSKFLRDREAAKASGQPMPVVPRAAFWKRIWPVYPLAALLALQLLRFVFPNDSSQARPPKSEPGDERPPVKNADGDDKSEAETPGPGHHADPPRPPG